MHMVWQDVCDAVQHARFSMKCYSAHDHNLQEEHKAALDKVLSQTEALEAHALEAEQYRAELSEVVTGHAHTLQCAIKSFMESFADIKHVEDSAADAMKTAFTSLVENLSSIADTKGQTALRAQDMRAADALQILHCGVQQTRTVLTTIAELDWIGRVNAKHARVLDLCQQITVRSNTYSLKKRNAVHCL